MEKILEEVRRLPAEQQRELLGRIEAECSQADEAAQAQILSSDQQQQLWSEWAATGPQGPIEDAGEPEFP